MQNISAILYLLYRELEHRKLNHDLLSLSLYTKSKKRWHCIFNFWMLLVFSAKHLWFLSQIVHQMQAGTVLHLFLLPVGWPSLFQQLRNYEILLGVAHCIPLKFKNILHSCEVPLQCKKKMNNCLCLFSTYVTSRVQGYYPLLARFSCVRTAPLASNQVKHATSYGILTFHIIFHGQLSKT